MAEGIDHDDSLEFQPPIHLSDSFEQQFVNISARIEGRRGRAMQPGRQLSFQDFAGLSVNPSANGVPGST